MVRSFGMVMLLKMRLRTIIVEQMIMEPVQIIIKIRTDPDLSNILRWSWFWKWNRGSSKWSRRLWKWNGAFWIGDDDQIQDGLLLRPLKRVTNGFHQRGLPCGLQVYFFCDYFIDPLIICHHCHLVAQSLKCKCLPREQKSPTSSWAAAVSSHIPDICQFWYTTALFRPVKVQRKVRKFSTIWLKLANIDLDFAFSMLKSPPAWKKSSLPLVVAVVTIISYVSST